MSAENIQVARENQKITELLKDGVLMNNEEVRSEIEHITWLIQSEVDALPSVIWQLRGIVGQHDVAREIIFSPESFRELVVMVEQRLALRELSLY